MKSTKKQVNRSYLSTLGIVLILLAAQGVGLTGQSATDILEFYWDRSAKTFADQDPSENNVRFRLNTFSYYKKVAKRGQETITDSVAIDYFYTGASLDSQVVRSGNPDRFDLTELTLPDIYTYDYIKQLYPNDDGRGGLAIGLDTDSVAVNQPTGLLLIDRNTYQPLSLYLYYQQFEDFIRFSRSYEIVAQDGYLFPDSVWIVAARPGFLQAEHFRIETDVRGIEILDD